MQNLPRPRPRPTLFYRGLLLLFLLSLPLVFRYDRELFNLLNCDPKRSAPALDFFFLLLTSLADGLWVMMLLSVVQSLTPRSFKALVIALVIGNVVLHTGKYFIDADRPLKVLGTAQTCVLGMPLTVRSFPSGHAFSAALVFMFLRPHKSWLKATALLLLVALAAISRVYVGAHFPKDVAIGFLLGVITFFAAEKIAEKISFRTASLKLRKGLVAFLGAGSALIYIFAYQEKTAELEFLLTPAAWMVFLYWWVYVVTQLLPREKTKPSLVALPPPTPLRKQTKTRSTIAPKNRPKKPRRKRQKSKGKKATR